MTARKTVLILGSGFSKAVFPDAMPTVTQLAERLRQEKVLKARPYDALAESPELLLSYLSLNQPWKEPAENLRDQALFVEVQQVLAEYIASCEGQAFQDPIPDWAGQLMEYLHKTRTPVITLNYDTVVERLVHRREPGNPEGRWPQDHNLYDLPLSPIWARGGNALLGTEVETFQLIKLHGSINWFYSGVEGFPGEQIYYRTVNSDSPAQDCWGHHFGTERGIHRLCQDKVPLIIPPVAEKSRFYENRTMRILWTAARKALAEAEEVLCVGYSLPVTDLTMKLFLRAVARPKEVTLVNKVDPDDGDGQGILKRYQEAFPEVKIDDKTFVCDDSVEKMTDSLLSRA